MRGRPKPKKDDDAKIKKDKEELERE